MEGGVAGAGQTGIALVDLDIGIALTEVDEMVFPWDPGIVFSISLICSFICILTYLRYIK